MEWKIFFDETFFALRPVLGLIVSYVLVAAARFILSHTDQFLAKRALEKMEQVILSIVMALMQTTVDNLKANNMNGKLSEKDAREVKARAVDVVNILLKEQDIKILEKNYGNLNRLVDVIIEQKVLETKMRRGLY